MRYLLFFWFSFSFIATLLLVPLCIKLACFLNIVDYPDGKLKIHKQPTPYLGGLAIFLPLIFCTMFYAPYLVLGLIVLFILGVVDDIKRLPAKYLILGHSLGALCFLFTGCIAYVTSFSLLNVAISFFWMVSIINAFNLIDVMDGVASVTALSVGFAFFITGILSQNYIIIVPFVALCGSLIAFVAFFNRPPARIYLGDAGSLLLGGFFGALSLIYANSAEGTVAQPIFLLIVPIGEIVGLIIIRSCKGIPFYQGSPDHFSHYLKRGGWNNSGILLLIFFVSMLGLVLSQAMTLDKSLAIAILPVVVLLVAIWAAYVAKGG